MLSERKLAVNAFSYDKPTLRDVSETTDGESQSTKYSNIIIIGDCIHCVCIVFDRC